jgi:cell division protein FtsB
VRRNPKMQAPLRLGKKEETMGRANGVTRTGRSLLFGLLLVAVIAASSLFYTWERLVVESMLQENLAIEKRLDLIEQRAEVLSHQVTSLEALKRIEPEAKSRLGMVPLEWKDVIVVEAPGGGLP